MPKRRGLELLNLSPTLTRGTKSVCGKHSENSTEKLPSMLWTIIVILIVLWALGLIGHIGGGLIHLLLVIAVIVLVLRILQGRVP